VNIEQVAKLIFTEYPGLLARDGDTELHWWQFRAMVRISLPNATNVEINKVWINR
jgi:hypothetical protein